MMMVKNKNSNNFLVLGSAILIFIAINILQISFKKPEINISKQESALNINQNFLKFFSMGNKRLISNIIWIQTLLESDTEHYSKKDKNSWMYHRFFSISVLDPLFYENYLHGGTYLSIIKDDLFGAADIFEEGLKYFPNDFKINYYLGFNYYFEQSLFEKSIPYLKKCSTHPQAPSFLTSIIKKLEFQTRREHNLILDYLKNELKNTKDEIRIKKIKSEIYSIKAERDLECLNQGKPRCEKKDSDNKPYLFINGEWKTYKKFNPFKIQTRN